MKNVILLLTIATFLLMPSMASAARGIPVQGSAQKRLALVIGNSAYDDAPLKNPINDAKDMSALLEKCGFDVMLELNASQREMEKAVRLFGKDLKKGGVGLFFYAGHAVQLNGRNYLIPVKSVIESEADVKYETVDAGLILGKMEDAGNEFNIVIIDACRNNPFARSFRSPTKGLARMDAPKGSLIAYATSPGSLAADGEGQNGIFTKHLIENIQKPGLVIEQVLKNVRIAVAEETSARQIPWESSSLMGNFYFLVKPEKPEPTGETAEISSAENAKLERERQALEKLKEELLALQRQEEDLKSRTTGNLLEEGFSKRSNGIVFDRKTSLEWFAGPDKGLSYEDAKSWANQLNIDAGKSWRLPTVKELETLYLKGVGPRNITSLILMRGCNVWSGDGSFWSPEIPCFDFCNGKVVNLSRNYRHFDSFRGLAVR